MSSLQTSIQEAKLAIVLLNGEVLGHQQIINGLNLSKQQLETINTKIASKDREMQDKKSLYEEYNILLKKFTSEAVDKSKELEDVQEELKQSSLNEANAIKAQMESIKVLITAANAKIGVLNKEVFHYNSNKAVIKHNIEQKTKDKIRLEELQKTLLELNAKLGMFPTVIQAFSTTGIPNLIIQNVLDDLQIEANNLLAQLKPGLQLSFFIEKTVEKTGDQADTLDINYHIKGKDRYYKQLSGAQQLAVAFSLKLGLSFLLQKLTGADIKFLLLDEIDQSLDKASVDAFVDIVKFFQKDFIILIITHNDRLKDKFSHAILVEQDINMISKARVVSSW
jgi:exonuclease SbcC